MSNVHPMAAQVSTPATHHWLTGHLASAVGAIVFANLALLYLYLAFELTLFQLVVIYWWECVWIGMFGGLKLIVASLFGSPYDTKHVGVSQGASLIFSVLAITFFGGKYLVFVMMLGFIMIGLPIALGGHDELELLQTSLQAIVLSSAVLFFGHAISFVVDFLVRREFRTARATRLLLWPYVRCGALLLAFIIAASTFVLAPAVATTEVFAVILIILKLAADVALHKRERGRDAFSDESPL